MVTGGAGFLGSHVAEHCLAMRTEVIIIDDLSNGFFSNIPSAEIFERGNVHNASFIDYIFRKYGDHREGKSIRFIYHNLAASALLIEHAVNYNVSCFVLTEHGFKESKDAVFGINYGVVRPHGLYGPSTDNVVGIFLHSLLNNAPMAIFGDGLQTRSFCHINDVAPYIAAAPLHPDLMNSTLNIGTERAYTLNQIALAVIGVFLLENPLIATQGGDHRHLEPHHHEQLQFDSKSNR